MHPNMVMAMAPDEQIFEAILLFSTVKSKISLSHPNVKRQYFAYQIGQEKQVKQKREQHLL